MIEAGISIKISTSPTYSIQLAKFKYSVNRDPIKRVCMDYGTLSCFLALVDITVADFKQCQ